MLKAAISGETRSSEAEDTPLFKMSFAGIEARGKLLSIAVSVEFSPWRTTALILDVLLPGSFDFL
jgi:hypothetical protein